MAKKETLERVKRKPVKPGKIDMTVINMAAVFRENENEKMDREIVVTNNNRIPAIEVMSNELQYGMIISAQDGERPKDKNTTNEDKAR